MQAVLANRQARGAKRAKREKTQPWKVLEEDWQDQIRKTNGQVPQDTAWGPAEKMLARRVIKETSLEEALRAAMYFITDWCPQHRKFPSFRLFWTVRAQITAELTGQVTTKRERLDADEPKPEQAKKFPKVGWS